MRPGPKFQFLCEVSNTSKEVKLFWRFNRVLFPVRTPCQLVAVMHHYIACKIHKYQGEECASGKKLAFSSLNAIGRALNIFILLHGQIPCIHFASEACTTGALAMAKFYLVTNFIGPM